MEKVAGMSSRSEGVCELMCNPGATRKWRAGGWLTSGNSDLLGIEKDDGGPGSRARGGIEERSLALGECRSQRESCGNGNAQF